MVAKILLVHPLFLVESPAERASASPYFPLGILYLAAYVRQNGHEVAVFDGTFAPSRAAFDTTISSEQPDVVGISCLSPTRETALALADRAEASGAFVIVGGPDPTADPRPYLAGQSVDVVVHHEGEQTIVALLDRVDAATADSDELENEPGIAFRRNGEVVVNQPRPPIENLDELPFPARDLIDLNRYLEEWDDTNGYSSLTIATSRGCPYQCSWCVDAVHGANYRQRSPESVAAEVHELKQSYDVARLRLVDDVDGIDREWLEAWADSAQAIDAAIPFEALNDLKRQDIPLLDVRDSL